MKPTLKSLAAELGLSITTVSRALADYDDVSPKTRTRVKQVAQRLGYIPNQSARRLVTGRADAVGMIVPLPHDELHDPFISELLVHIAQALHRLPHLDLLLSYAHQGDSELDIYRRFVQGRRVDAFIIARTRKNDPRVDFLLHHHMPFISHGRTGQSADHAWVDTDARHGFALATRRLIEYHHRRIVLLNLPSDLYTAELRSIGFHTEMSAAGLAGTVVNCELQERSAYQTTLGLLRQTPAPTALLCASDVLALGALKALRELGLSPGKDVSIVGCDDLSLVRLLEPELASLSYSFQHLGEVMVDLLQQAMQQTGSLPRQLIRYQLVERKTLGVCHRP